MIPRKLLFGLFLCISYLVNCQEVIKIDLNKFRNIKRQPNLSEITTDIAFIKLETNERCLIGEINKITLCENNFLILANARKNLYIFSRTGQFLRQIGRQGKGPGEYIDIYGITVDPLTQHIYLLDNPQIQVMEFSPSGDFIQETNLSFSAKDVVNFDKGFVFYIPSPYAYNNENHLLTQTSLSLGNIERFHPSPNFQGNPYKVGAFYLNKYEICFWEPYWDTVYAFNGSVVKPKYYFYQGKDQVPKKLLPKTSVMWREIDKYFYLHNFKEFKTFIYFEVIDVGRKAKRIYYNKDKNEGYYLSYTEESSNWGIIDDISGGPIISLDFKLSLDEAVSTHEITHIKELVSKGVINVNRAKNPEKFHQLLNLVNISDIQDNPILAIVKFK